MSALCAQISLSNSSTIGKQSVSLIKDMKVECDTGLFEPTAKIRATDDLDVRAKVKVEIMNERIKNINKRRTNNIQ